MPESGLGQEVRQRGIFSISLPSAPWDRAPEVWQRNFVADLRDACEIRRPGYRRSGQFLEPGHRSRAPCREFAFRNGKRNHHVPQFHPCHGSCKKGKPGLHEKQVLSRRRTNFTYTNPHGDPAFPTYPPAVRFAKPTDIKEDDPDKYFEHISVGGASSMATDVKIDSFFKDLAAPRKKPKMSARPIPRRPTKSSSRI